MIPLLIVGASTITGVFIKFPAEMGITIAERLLAEGAQEIISSFGL